MGSPTLTATPASSTQVNLSWSGVTGRAAVQRELVAEPRRSGSNHGGEPRLVKLPGVGPEPVHELQLPGHRGGRREYVERVECFDREYLAGIPDADRGDGGFRDPDQPELDRCTGASDYVIYDKVMGTPTRLANAGTSLSDSLTGLSPYTTYQLEVGAIGPWGISYSSVRPVTTLPTSPVLSATPTSASQINLRWSSVSGTSDYVVYENTGSGFKEYGDTGTGTSFSATNLSANSNYSFEVADIGPWGVTWSNVVSPLTLPSAPAPVRGPRRPPRSTSRGAMWVRRAINLT